VVVVVVVVVMVVVVMVVVVVVVVLAAVAAVSDKKGWGNCEKGGDRYRHTCLHGAVNAVASCALTNQTTTTPPIGSTPGTRP
jgi:hypothetical protein